MCWRRAPIMKNGTSSKPTKTCPSLGSAATHPCNCAALVIPLCQNQGTEFQPRGMRLVSEDALKPVLSRLVGAYKRTKTFSNIIWTLFRRVPTVLDLQECNQLPKMSIPLQFFPCQDIYTTKLDKSQVPADRREKVASDDIDHRLHVAIPGPHKSVTTSSFPSARLTRLHVRSSLATCTLRIWTKFIIWKGISKKSMEMRNDYKKDRQKCIFVLKDEILIVVAQICKN